MVEEVAVAMDLYKGNHTHAVLTEDGFRDGYGVGAQELLDLLQAAKAQLTPAQWAAARIDAPDEFGQAYTLLWPWGQDAPPV